MLKEWKLRSNENSPERLERMRFEEPKRAGAKPAVVYQPVMRDFGPAGSPRDPLLGCPVHELRARLRGAGLRPTRQRVALGWLLFAKGDRHVTAEMLYEEATSSRVRISLATVYNTLHQFTQAGLLREIAVDGSKTYFDTNMSDHHHFLFEGSNQLLDIPTTYLDVVRLPEIPEGMEVARVDVVVRLRKKSTT